MDETRVNTELPILTCFEMPEVLAMETRSRELREFKITNFNPQLRMGQQAILTGLGSGKLVFPAREPKEGRSVYAHTKGGIFPFGAIKAKGLFGTTLLEDRSWRLCASYPEIKYSGAATHLALTSEMRIVKVKGKPKSLYSLRYDSAVNEFNVQSRLAQHGLAFPGLAAGRFQLNNQPQLDLYNAEIGVSFTAHDPTYQELMNFVAFTLLRRPDGGISVIRPPRGPLAGRKGSLVIEDQMINYVVKFAERIGKLRQRCHLEAGVGRHVGHSGNFLYSEEKDELLVTDTDSAVLLESLEEDRRGPLVIRDIAADMLRWTEELCTRCFEFSIVEGIKRNRYPIFRTYLSGYFSGLVGVNEIEKTAMVLQHKLYHFLTENRSLLNEISASKTKKLFTHELPSSTLPERKAWFNVFFPFIEPLIAETYLLARKSDLRQRFLLPDYTPDEIRELLANSMREFLESL
jgi:hypothetical protein